jgi:hypothetical protein
MTRRALLVGINRYPDPANRLSGCVNDVLQVSDLLHRGFGFDPTRDIRLLTDERATTRRIIERLHWLVGGARPGDVLVFHYSGHGSQVRDRHGDELDDGLDEIICPYDLDWDDPFTDDDLFEIVRTVPNGVNLTVVLDCCHAGTGLREPLGPPPSARVRRVMAPPDIRHRAALAIAEPLSSDRSASTGRRATLPLRRFGGRAAARGAILIAACRSDQVSADAWLDNGFHGALTFFLCRALAEAGFRAAYRESVTRVRRLLAAEGFDQVPQLECSELLAAMQVFAPLAAEAAA